MIGSFPLIPATETQEAGSRQVYVPTRTSGMMSKGKAGYAHRID